MSLSYGGDMMYSSSAYAASNVNLTCVSPPWGAKFEAGRTSLYLIEREGGVDRLMFNVRKRVPEYDFYEA